jgi:hypothetical protein
VAAAWAPSTRAAYNAASIAFIEFWHTLGGSEGDLSELPEGAVSDPVMAAFVAWLSCSKGMAPRSVELYRAGVLSLITSFRGRF